MTFQNELFAFLEMFNAKFFFRIVQYSTLSTITMLEYLHNLNFAPKNDILKL